MRLAATDSERRLQEEVRDFLAREAFDASALPHALDERMDVLRVWQARCYEAGFVGRAWPREFGGGGAPAAEQIVIDQELAAAGAPEFVNVVGLDVLGPSLPRFGHERGTAALPRQVKLRTWLDRAVRVASERRLHGDALIDDPETQVALARALIGIEVLRHHAYRTVGEFLNGGAVGPDSSSVKLLMAEAEQRLAASVLEVLGPTLQHGDPGQQAEDAFWNE